jgi:hypothetical protein
MGFMLLQGQCCSVHQPWRIELMLPFELQIRWDSVMSLSTQEKELAGSDSASRLAVVNFH